jgi:hypothetical protein
VPKRALDTELRRELRERALRDPGVSRVALEQPLQEWGAVLPLSLVIVMAAGDAFRTERPMSHEDSARPSLPGDEPRPEAAAAAAGAPPVQAGRLVQPGGRWGIAGLAGGLVGVSPAGPAAAKPWGGALLAVGVRFGLLERAADRRQWMPAIAVLIGSTFDPLEAAPFAELRGEVMSVSPSGPLQPNFLAYVSSGVDYAMALDGLSHAVRPHAGLGLGWNWRPEGWPYDASGQLDPTLLGRLLTPTSQGDFVVITALVVVGMGLFLAAAVVAAFVFAGHLELRYTVSPDAARAPGFLSVMIGIGA